MQDREIFRTVAEQHGFDPQAIPGALAYVADQLQSHGHAAGRYFYGYRTGAQSMGGDATGATRPRLVLMFATADSALAFAQHNRLGAAPRLFRASLAQLLAILVQRPSIGTLLFVDEPVQSLPRGQFPSGVRLEREQLLAMLEGA